MSESSKHDGKDYHISFFRPTTKLATFNRNLSITLVLIWAICIYGFQVLLKVMEKPTPEKAYLKFEQIWPNLINNSANDQEKQVFIQSALSVLGKVTIQAEDRNVLNSAVSNYYQELVPETQFGDFETKLQSFKTSKFGEEDYNSYKKAISADAAKVIGVPSYSLEAKLIPLELAAATSSQVNIEKVEAVMAKYLIHNQSVLTDTVFLGFPFHYFYTGVFLMILFVGICWYYCVATDRAMRRLGIEEE